MTFKTENQSQIFFWLIQTMASAFLDREVVTISSESEEEVRKKVRKMSLYQLAATNFLVYVDDANFGEGNKKEEDGEVFEDKLDDNGNKILK